MLLYHCTIILSLLGLSLGFAFFGRMASQERVTRPTERRFYGAGEALRHPNLNLLGWFLTGRELQIMVFVLLPVGCLFFLLMFLPNHLKIPRRQIYI